MLVKNGINTSRASKAGPTMRKSINTNTKITKVVTCSVCKCKLEKSCPNEMMCEISVLQCPKCGSDVK